MDPNQQRTLMMFVEKVSELRQARSAALSTEERRQIARELGLSDDDLAFAEKASRDYFLRGQGFLKHGRLDDAVRELQAAAVLAPENLEANFALASALVERFSSYRAPTDREDAQQAIRRCLSLEPQHDASFALLNRLDQVSLAPLASQLPQTIQLSAPPVAPRPQAPPQAPPRPQAAPQASPPPAPRPLAAPPSAGRAVLLPILGGTGVIGGLVLLGFLSASGPSPRPRSSYEPPPYTPAVPSVNSLLGNQGGSTPIASPAPVKDDEPKVPVELVQDEQSAGLVLAPHDSHLSLYSTSSFFNLTARLSNQSQMQINELNLELVLLSASGTPLATEEIRAVQDYQPDMRPGDIISFHALVQTTPEVKTARLRVLTRKESKATKNYPEAKELQVSLGTALPPGVSLVFRERVQNKNDYGFGSSFLATEWEAENTGDAPLGLLRVRLDQLDKKGNIVETDTHYFLASDDAPLEPGEKRTAGGTFGSKAGVSGYTLTVLEARAPR
jgi:hypothetical protein